MTNLHRQSSSALDSSRTVNQVSNLGEAFHDLERRLDRLALVNKAMWTLLRDKTGLSDIELRSMILEIDAADHTRDGGVLKQVCTDCGRSLVANLGRCQYCNAEVTQTDPFRV